VSRHALAVTALWAALSAGLARTGAGEVRAHWGFDEAEGRLVRDAAGGSEGAVEGYLERTSGVRGSALRFDGRTTRVRVAAAHTPSLEAGFTIEAWVALYAYPWNWTAILDQAGAERPRAPVEPPAEDLDRLDPGPAGEWESRVFFGMDARGRLGLRIATRSGFRECVAARPLPQLAWTHVAASLGPDGAARLYAGGEPVASCATDGALTPARGGPLLLGRSHRRLGPTVSERRPSAEALSPMVLDGALDEVRVHDRVLAPEAIAAAARADGAPSLARPRLPSGPPELVPRFAAAYGRLLYTEAWEEPWRVGAFPDLLIRFDRLPARLLFWRGTGYGAAWVTENGRWMGDQSLERSGGTPLGTAEHMNDKQTRYSRASLIEDGEARKIVHWRYALTDIGYGLSRERETRTGERAEELYTIYPDGVAVRHQLLWTDDLRHEWQETIVVHRPGDRPEDNIELEALELANLEGETRSWSWAEGAPEAFDAPAEANIQLTRLKAEYRPFIVFEPRPRIRPFRSAIRPEVSHFPWWNHWPVAQLPNDGRRAEGPGRPGHSSLSQAIEESEVVHARPDGAYEVVTLVGLTDRPIGELVPLARSWLRPPPLELEGDGFASLGYERRERAFVFERRGSGVEALELRVAASPGSPLVNPALVVQGWGESEAALRIDGAGVARGPDFRSGRRRDLSGRSDLVVWLALRTTQPVTLRLEPRGEAP